VISQCKALQEDAAMALHPETATHEAETRLCRRGGGGDPKTILQAATLIAVVALAAVPVIVFAQRRSLLHGRQAEGGP
jgi:hypothetical protein